MNESWSTHERVLFMDAAHWRDRIKNIWIFRLAHFTVCCFEWQGLPFTPVKHSLEFWGLPWKPVWKLLGLPWKLVGKIGSRHYFKSDLLRLRSQMNESWSTHERVISQMKESCLRSMSHVSNEYMNKTFVWNVTHLSCILVRHDSCIWSVTLSSETWHVRGRFMTYSSETAGGGDRTWKYMNKTFIWVTSHMNTWTRYSVETWLIGLRHDSFIWDMTRS